jgi:nitroreductase
MVGRFTDLLGRRWSHRQFNSTEPDLPILG